MINFAAFADPEGPTKVDFFMSIIEAMIAEARSKGVDELPVHMRAEAFAKVIVTSEINHDTVTLIAALCLALLTQPSAPEIPSPVP